MAKKLKEEKLRRLPKEAPRQTIAGVAGHTKRASVEMFNESSLIRLLERPIGEAAGDDRSLRKGRTQARVGVSRFLGFRWCVIGPFMGSR
jgi:hypothetical protein